MEGTVLRGFPVSKGLRNAACVSIIIGLLRVSACSAATPVALSCAGDSKFVSGSLNRLQSQVELQCKDGYTLFPSKLSKQFFKDTACTKEVSLTDETVAWEQPAQSVGLLSPQKADSNILRLVKNPEKSETIYFQCRKNEVVQNQHPVAKEAETPEVSCTIQVAVYGATAVATEDEERKSHNLKL
ncbi:UNVERIFIED_CONTAM: SAG-related sequence protein SRS55M [Hammondia hammondi]|eukprot:XP_008886475.1 SAG-related sequence protein SRS55M [Hammondia hammondi]